MGKQRIKLGYSLAETAEVTSLSLSTLRRRIADGTVETVRIGQRVIVPARTLEALLTPDGSR